MKTNVIEDFAQILYESTYEFLDKQKIENPYYKGKIALTIYDAFIKSITTEENTWTQND